jgi:hypothetical protein
MSQFLSFEPQNFPIPESTTVAYLHILASCLSSLQGAWVEPLYETIRPGFG